MYVCMYVYTVYDVYEVYDVYVYVYVYVLIMFLPLRSFVIATKAPAGKLRVMPHRVSLDSRRGGGAEDLETSSDLFRQGFGRRNEPLLMLVMLAPG